MGLIERVNMVLISAAVTPHSHTSPLFNRLLYGHDTEPHRIFKDGPNATICEDSAQNTRVPHDMSGRAKSIWRASHPREFYGDPYKTLDSRTHFNQSFGLIMPTTIASHLIRVHIRVRTVQTTRTNFDDDTTSTASGTTTASLPIIMEEQPLSPSPNNTNDGPLNFPKTLLVNTFVVPKVWYPMRNITIVTCSQWIPSWLLVIASS